MKVKFSIDRKKSYVSKEATFMLGHKWTIERHDPCNQNVIPDKQQSWQNFYDMR